MCLVSLRPTAKPANTTIEKVLACTYFNNGYAEWLQIYEAVGLNTLLSRVRQRNHEKPYNTEKEPYCCGNGYRTITVLLYRWWMLEWWSYQNIKILKSIIIYWIVHRSYFPICRFQASYFEILTGAFALWPRVETWIDNRRLDYACFVAFMYWVTIHYQHRPPLFLSAFAKFHRTIKQRESYLIFLRYVLYYNRGWRCRRISKDFACLIFYNLKKLEPISIILEHSIPRVLASKYM